MDAFFSQFQNDLSILAINTVTLLGRVGSTPQVRGNDKYPVTTFSMATHVNFKYVTHDRQNDVISHV